MRYPRFLKAGLKKKDITIEEWMNQAIELGLKMQDNKVVKVNKFNQVEPLSFDDLLPYIGKVDIGEGPTNFTIPRRHLKEIVKYTENIDTWLRIAIRARINVGIETWHEYEGMELVEIDLR